MTYNGIDDKRNRLSDVIRNPVSDIVATSKKKAHEPHEFGNLSSKEVSDLIRGDKKSADIRKIKLSKGAIKSIETDPRNVTEMMRTEDAVEFAPMAEAIGPP